MMMVDDDSVGDDGGSVDDSHKIVKYSRSVTQASICLRFYIQAIRHQSCHPG
jgi:hypothetical protein